MHARILVVVAAALVFAPSVLAAPPGEGPFAGTVRDGQTDRHRYNNNPLNLNCIQIVVQYTVVMKYTPPTDVLTLTAADETVVGANGTATVTFERSFCTKFTILVEGTEVATVAAYEITVTRGGGEPI